MHLKGQSATSANEVKNNFVPQIGYRMKVVIQFCRIHFEANYQDILPVQIPIYSFCFTTKRDSNDRSIPVTLHPSVLLDAIHKMFQIVTDF